MLEEMEEEDLKVPSFRMRDQTCNSHVLSFTSNFSIQIISSKLFNINFNMNRIALRVKMKVL